MTQTERTPPSIEIPQIANDPVFLTKTRDQALDVLSKEHGGLIKALGDPARNLIDWILHRQASPENAANVIDARTRFNTAANYSMNPDSQESKKAA